MCSSVLNSTSQVLITNGNLELVDEGVEYVIRLDKKYLDGFVSTHVHSVYTIAETDVHVEWVRGVLNNMERYVACLTSTLPLQDIDGRAQSLA